MQNIILIWNQYKNIREIFYIYNIFETFEISYVFYIYSTSPFWLVTY